jgi:epoxide hydrolase-like predicted phosphatase
VACAPDCAIEAVLFDFGGVFTGSPFHAVRESRHLGEHDPEVMIEIVFGPYDRDTDHPWHRLERGELSLYDAHKLLCELAIERGLEIDPFDTLKGMSFSDGTADDFVERTLRLRAEGYRTALVTNNVREFSDGWRKLIPVDELFDVVVDSCMIGMRKPDPRIFHRALEELGGIAPERAVFLDDFAGNVDAAIALGMHGILVGVDRPAAITVLDDLLAAHV